MWDSNNGNLLKIKFYWKVSRVQGCRWGWSVGSIAAALSSGAQGATKLAEKIINILSEEKILHS